MKSNWNWTEANKMVRNGSLERVRKAAGVIRDQVKANCPVGTVSRPMYRSGPNAGQPWTARDAGRLKESVRVVELREDKYGFAFTELGILHGIVRVYCGNRLAYYARIVEYSKPFMRPAAEATKGRVKEILENG